MSSIKIYFLNDENNAGSFSGYIRNYPGRYGSVIAINWDRKRENY